MPGDRLASKKPIWKCTMRGGRRRRGRQQKGWEDNIKLKEWTDPEFANSQRAVGNRGRWRELVAKSRRWCPNDPYYLRVTLALLVCFIA